ncbi:aspartate aminotransferase family protein [Micromonospora sp. NPDC049282]|uniref:class-III pyridoxal-phosphate-dependent aminotransferase n=1 Tax=Micromonospora sp. NPDC049282 TaxID=3364269 RepID=UPI0037210285
MSESVRSRDHVLSTAPRRFLPQVPVVGAEGSWLWLADGGRLLDFHGQHMCIGIGHRHPKLTAALHDAIDRLDYVADFFPSEEKDRVARLIVEETMAGSPWAGAVRFVSSGSEATEMAIMIARLFQNRPLIVTRDLAYHGWTAGAAAVTGVGMLRNGFTPEGGASRPVPGSHPQPSAPAPICVSCPLGRTYPGCKDADGTLACVNATERVIRSAGVDRVAAFITEIWHGAGAFLVPDEYVRQIRDLTRRLGVLWIDDEAISGMGRTGRWWAFQHHDVQPDIMTAAKGLGSSAVPVGACVVSREIADYFATGFWGHSSTFAGHPLAMAAVAATLDIMIEENVIARVASLGDVVRDRLADMVARHPSAASVGGRGLVWGIELVRDPETGRRWVPEDRWRSPGLDPVGGFQPAGFVVGECARRGVLLLSYAPNTITIAPPLRISDEELEIGLGAIDAALYQLDELAAA